VKTVTEFKKEVTPKAYEIKKAAVLGSGVMGMAIASHLAGCGIDVLVLDIVPFDSMLSEKEQAKRDAGDKSVRNKLVNQALKTALKLKPPQPAFYSKNDAKRISVGNFDDDMERIADCDLIIEVVVERLDIKKQVFAKVDANRKETSIVCTNTSGLSVEKMVEDCSDSLKSHFLGTHFFNPVRFMKLLEIIPHPQTDAGVLSFMESFSTDTLGKGVVNAKDTPNFIGNRIGVHSMMLTMATMLELDYRIDEVDAICGTAIGNARSAVYKTADLVGLDTLSHVAKTVYDNCPDDDERELCNPPELMLKMIENKWLGRKAKSGFYKRGPKKEKLVLDWKTMEYVPQDKFEFDSITKAKESSRNPGKRLKKVLEGDDRAAVFAWKVTAGGLLYAAKRIPEIADRIHEVDKAMRWGFNRSIGPFEAWDAIGVRESVERMKADGYAIPAHVEEMLAKGNESFYKEENGVLHQYNLLTHEYEAIPSDPKVFIIKKQPDLEKVAGNDSATLWHMGDGVLLYEMHTPKANAISDETVEMQEKGVDLLEAGKYEAMVLGNNSDNFCVGANLMLVVMAIHGEQLDAIEKTIYGFQKANMRMKYCSKPIVAAPVGYVFGGGCELIQHCHKVVGAAESYIGLVEVGVGLIPAGGGTKEMVMRAVEGIDMTNRPSLLPFVRGAFENIAKADVATSFKQAVDLGYIRDTDKMVVNAEYRLHEAKAEALKLAAMGINPGSPRTDIPVAGESGTAAFMLAVEGMKDAGWASEYDQFIANKVAYIIGGGQRAEGQTITEWELLDLEREAFMSLLGEQKTQDRIQHMLMTRKPLRN
jgi:3-hydroxyacyl-CoA dehydrogenase